MGDEDEVKEDEVNEDEDEVKEDEVKDLDREAEEEEENKEKFDENDLPEPTEQEENLSTLEKVRKQLHELRKRFQDQRRSIRLRIIDSYIMVVDSLIERLKKHQLDNTRFNDFVKHVKKVLESYKS